MMTLLVTSAATVGHWTSSRQGSMPQDLFTNHNVPIAFNDDIVQPANISVLLNSGYSETFELFN